MKAATALIVPKAILLTRPAREGGFLAFALGWVWRLVAGTFLCFNVFVLNYFTSIAVLGWLERWMQGRILYGWWKQSGRAGDETFEQFCRSLGPDAPVLRPRWFRHERAEQAPSKLAGPLRRLLRLVALPIGSLWLNVKLGFQSLFCVYLLTGWGCVVMMFSWEAGWINSFHKGYELAWLGPTTGLVGILLFILAMLYVPMAQAHQAAVGQTQAFFHFRFVWQLVRTRLTPYFGLALLYLFFGILIAVMRGVFLSDDFPGNWESLTASEQLVYLRSYLAWCSAGFFVALLVLRGFAARIYRSAVLKALANGSITRDDLHPRLRGWLDRLGLVPVPAAPPPFLAKAVIATSRWSHRRILFTLLFVIWMLYVIVLYTHNFLVAHPFLAFLNHPLIQIPCIDYTPAHLVAGS